MKRTTKQSAPPPSSSTWTGKKHLLVLCGLLAAWLLLFGLVLLEHAQSWARLLPMLFVVLVIYGAVVTRKIIKEIKHSRE